MFTKTIGLACIAAFTSAMQLEAAIWKNINDMVEAEEMDEAEAAQWEDIIALAQVSASAPQHPTQEERHVLLDQFNWAKEGGDDAKRLSFKYFTYLMDEHGVKVTPPKAGCNANVCGNDCHKGKDLSGGFC